MPGKPLNHRTEWEPKELETLRDMMAAEMSDGTSAWKAAKRLRSHFHRRPSAIASAYYRKIARTQDPKVKSAIRYFAVPEASDILSADTPEELVKAIAENEVKAEDMSKVKIIRGEMVVLKSKTTYLVEEA